MAHRRLPHAAWLPVALAAAALGACGGGHDGTVAMAVRSSGLADSPIAIDLRGLRAGERVTLHARWRAFGGHPWSSTVALRASDSGTVRLRGAGAARLLSTMRPAGPAFKHPYFLPPAKAPSDVEITLTDAGRTLARTTVSRRISPPSVRLRELTKRRDSVVGFLFTPRVRARRPAVVVFGGSEGGNAMIDVAGMLAAHGYPTLSLTYFGVPGLPSELVDIPLEYFARAVRVLRRSPHVDAGRISVMGASRGGELALLLASAFPHLIHGAVGLVPSATVYPAPAAQRDAWTFRGQAVPIGDIAVERIAGPVLTAGAGDDRVWASKASVEKIEHRLDAHHFRFPHRGLVYDHAGHGIGSALPYLPAPDANGLGGTPRADAAAEADLWPRIVRFFAAQARS